MSQKSPDFRRHSATRKNLNFSSKWESSRYTRCWCFSIRGNWSVGHMRRLSCARRKVATAGCEGGGVMRGDSGGGGGVFPHYKFNLTNGSENLETMEYMKCGRVYHAGGDVGWFRRQYCQGRSIFSESATARGPSGFEGERKWFPPGMRANCKTCFWHDKKSRARR